MIDFGNTVISKDIIKSCFVCDLSVCKGACCIHGDAGAPLGQEEVDILKKIYRKIKPFLRKEGIESIRKFGTSTTDAEMDTVTPLIEGKECAYAYFENGIARCAIEKAYLEGIIAFRKPASCHLYPIRIKKYKNFDAINYDRWEICKAAISLGDEMQMPLYRFVSEALIRKYGKEWFNGLEAIARHLLNDPAETPK